MKSDLSKVKVGDKIWTIQEGWGEVSDWTEWAELKEPTITELTLEQIAEKFGISVEQLKIKK